MGVALCGLGKVDACLVGHGREPGEHVGELDRAVHGTAAEERTRQLTNLLDEPREGARQPSRSVARAIRLTHEALEVGDVHATPTREGQVTNPGTRRASGAPAIAELYA